LTPRCAPSKASQNRYPASDEPGVTRTVLAAEWGTGGLLFHLTLLVKAGHRSVSHLAKQVGPWRNPIRA
jgi:hypothetical protein